MHEVVQRLSIFSCRSLLHPITLLRHRLHVLTQRAHLRNMLRMGAERSVLVTGAYVLHVHSARTPLSRAQGILQAAQYLQCNRVTQALAKRLAARLLRTEILAVAQAPNEVCLLVVPVGTLCGRLSWPTTAPRVS